MPARYAWAFENPNKNFSDRVLRAQVAITKPARRGCGRGSPTQAAAWEEMLQQVADGCELAFEMPVSSVVLASASEFFRVELEKYRMPGEPVVVTIDDGQQDLLYALIRFIYTDELAESDAGVLLRLLLLAQQFAVDDCVSRCAKALSEPGQMSYEVALEICQRAAQQECLGDTFASLCKVSADVMLNKFRSVDAVWANKALRLAFLRLPLAAVKVLLGHADLQVRSENTVFLMTAWWLEHADGRLDSFSAVQPLIRWSQMSGSFLETVFFEEIMHIASPLLAPRPQPAGSDDWPSAITKVPESELQLLDKFVTDGVGSRTLVCNGEEHLLHVAGYVAQLELEVVEREGGGKGLGIFVQLRIALPGQTLDPSDLAMVAFSWKVTMGTARNKKTWYDTDYVQKPFKANFGKRFSDAEFASDGRPGAPVTRALQDAGFIKEGTLPITLQVSCAS